MSCQNIVLSNYVSNYHTEGVMQKFLKATAIVAMFGVGYISFNNCYGSFKLTKKIYQFNGSVKNKFLKSLVMWVLIIVPVYSIGAFVDVVILNLLEFWTGSNPLAMGPNDKETQVVEAEGNKYQIVATQNRFDIEQLTGKEKGRKVALEFDVESASWNIVQNGKRIKIAELDKAEAETVRLFHPDGQTVSVKL